MLAKMIRFMHQQTRLVKKSIEANPNSDDFITCKQLSVITLTYNNFEQLVQTLESIKSIRPKEVLVINGGNCDKTLKYLNFKSDQFKDYFSLRHISETDEGIYDAMNKGIKNSTGKFINFLNSSDRVCDPKYFREAIIKLNSKPELAYICSSYISGNIKHGYQYNSKRDGIYYSLNGKKQYIPNHQTMIYQKSIFEQVGLFNTSFKIAGDLDHHLRILEKNIYKYIYIPSIIFDDGWKNYRRWVNTHFERTIILKRRKILISNLVQIIGHLIDSVKEYDPLRRIIHFLKFSILLGFKNIKYNDDISVEYQVLNIDKYVVYIYK